MNKIKIILIASLSILLLFSCSTLRSEKASGNIITENRTLGSFSKIECYKGVMVYLLQGDANSVKIVADDNVIEYLTTKINNNTLEIKMDKDFKKLKSLKVYVTFVDIDKLDVSLGAMVSAEKELDMDKFSIQVSTGSIVNMKGKIKNLILKADTGSILSCKEFIAENCTLNASTGSICDVYVTKNLILNVDSGSIVDYYGKPVHKDVSKSIGAFVNSK